MCSVPVTLGGGIMMQYGVPAPDGANQPASSHFPYRRDAQAVGDLLEQQRLHLATGVVHQLVGVLVDRLGEQRLEVAQEQQRAVDRRGCLGTVLDNVREQRDLFQRVAHGVLAVQMLCDRGSRPASR